MRVVLQNGIERRLVPVEVRDGIAVHAGEELWSTFKDLTAQIIDPRLAQSSMPAALRISNDTQRASGGSALLRRTAL